MKEWLKRYFNVPKGVAMALLIVALAATQKGTKSEAFLAALVYGAPVFFMLGGLIEGLKQWRRDRAQSRASAVHPPMPAQLR